MKQLGRNGRDVTVEKTRLERVLHCLACLPSQQLSRKVVLRTFSLPLLTQLTTIHRHNSPPSPTRLTSIDSLLFSLPHTHYSLPSPPQLFLTASHTLLTSITLLLFSLPRTYCSTLYKRLPSTTPLPQNNITHAHDGRLQEGDHQSQTGRQPRRSEERGAHLWRRL